MRDNLLSYYNEGKELRFVLSLLSVKELYRVKDAILFTKWEKCYQWKSFPFSAGQLGMLASEIDYELAYRRGKSIRIVEGKSVECERTEDNEWNVGDWRLHDQEERVVQVETQLLPSDGRYSVDEEEGEWV